MSFYSNRPPNRLVIPKEHFLTLYHFAKEATDEIIKDLFYHIRSLVHSKCSGQWQGFAVHTGSVGSNPPQTVPHVHFRLEGDE